MNIKQLCLSKLGKDNILRDLRRRKDKVWQKMIFNLNWRYVASPQRAATMAIESDRLSLEFERLDREISAIERKW